MSESFITVTALSEYDEVELKKYFILKDMQNLKGTVLSIGVIHVCFLNLSKRSSN